MKGAALLICGTILLLSALPGAFEVVIHEMSCGDPSMCNLHGTRSMLGTNFTYYTSCCSTDLCNKSAGTVPRPFWGLLVVSTLSIVLGILH
ncbi:hypothetical protein JRQ81_003473 [Phrynocephalus forsythii]|uniref:UPAR/Ly6 domain-containing protein n=1 Tax=Phrynocephalus forsythii TaxID=171643 RepID=A0A9Q1AX85_9SAUR|nr:hypothetical protein JRQ81_003473 [Phrynocephalus forsythii]